MTPIDIDDKNVLIEEETWRDAQADEQSATFSTLYHTIVGVLTNRGAFMIHREGGDVLRRFDSQGDFEAYLEEINAERQKAGRPTLNY